MHVLSVLCWSRSVRLSALALLSFSFRFVWCVVLLFFCFRFCFSLILVLRFPLCYVVGFVILRVVLLAVVFVAVRSPVSSLQSFFFFLLLLACLSISEWKGENRDSARLWLRNCLGHMLDRLVLHQGDLLRRFRLWFLIFPPKSETSFVRGR